MSHVGQEVLRRPEEEMSFAVAAALGVDETSWRRFLSLLAPLADHDICSYLHCLRVGIYAARLASFAGAKGVDPVVALQGGTAHDLGKLDVPHAVLHARPFGQAERQVVSHHALAGFHRLRETNYQVAVIAGLHHAFQHDPYGLEPGPSVPKDLLATTRLVAMCDVFDAVLTRVGSPGHRDPTMARQIAERYFPDQRGWGQWLAANPVPA